MVSYKVRDGTNHEKKIQTKLRSDSSWGILLDGKKIKLVLQLIQEKMAKKQSTKVVFDMFTPPNGPWHGLHPTRSRANLPYQLPRLDPLEPTEIRRLSELELGFDDVAAHSHQWSPKPRNDRYGLAFSDRSVGNDRLSAS